MDTNDESVTECREQAPLNLVSARRWEGRSLPTRRAAQQCELAEEAILDRMIAVDDPGEDRRRLNLPPPSGLKLTSGSFEVPETVVKVNLMPELVGEMFVLLAEAVELGVDAAWFRPKFESAASTVVETASGREYLQAFVDLAVLAHRHDLLSSAEVHVVHSWADDAKAPAPPPTQVPVETRASWDQARATLQSWLDPLDVNARKKVLRQRSIARVACGDCHSMLAWLVPQSEFEFLVLARGDGRDFEVAHAVGEYGGYARTRCGRKRGGRLWVLHADHLRRWLDDGHPDVNLRHADKGS